MDTSYVEMFTNELFTDDDNNTVTLAEESHSLNTPPMVDLVDDLVDLSEDEQQHVVVDLSGDPESTQEVVQEHESEVQEVIPPPEPDTQEIVQEHTASCTSSAPSPPSPVTTEPKIKVTNTFAEDDVRQKTNKSTMEDYNAREQEKAAKAKAKGKDLLKDSKAKTDSKGKKDTFAAPKVKTDS